MRARGTLWALFVTGASAAVAVACGGSSTDGAFQATDGGSDASSKGGASGGSAAGGKGGVSNGGAGGGAGGGVTSAGGSSGAPGTGGSPAGDAGVCPGPGLPGTTRICLNLVPEKITPKAGDPALDEHGVLIVQIFDTDSPPDKDADKIALAQKIFPKDAVLGGPDGAVSPEVALSDLKEIRFDNAFPATVYVRAFFIDNMDVLKKKDGTTLGYGTWLAGLNLADGITDKEPLLAVPLNVGQGNVVTMPLMAFRKLKVTVHRSATAIGDGQGPLSVIAVNNVDPATKPGIFGVASHKCADVSTADVTVTGFAIGAGPLWAVGVLNDLGTKGDLPPGALASLDVTPTTYRIPTKLTYAATDYSIETTVNLNYAIPWPADAGVVPPNSCADLASGPDGG